MDYTDEEKQIDEWRSQLEKLMITEIFIIRYHEKNGLRVEVIKNNSVYSLDFITANNDRIFVSSHPINIQDYEKYKDTVNDIIEDLKTVKMEFYRLISKNIDKIFDEHVFGK